MTLYNILIDLTKFFYLRQVGVILGIFLLGYIFIQLTKEKISDIWQLLLSFPVGLSLYAVTGFVLLSLGVEFEVGTIAMFLFVVIAELTLRLVREKVYIAPLKLSLLIFTMLGVAIVAWIAVSGALPVEISNDSVYYYSTYPKILVEEKFYDKSFDVFLTDVGQTAAVINALPFFFGFDQTFGVQHFMNINFCCIFFMAAFESGKSRQVNKKKAATAALLATLFLLTSEPFLITVRWVLANVYFMEYLFIFVFIAYKMSERLPENSVAYSAVQMVTGMMLTMLRVEGGVFVCIMVLIFSLLKYDRGQMLRIYVIPIAAIQILYYLNLYIRLRVDPLYSFLDIKKSMIAIGTVLFTALYVIFFRERLNKLYGKFMPILFIALLAAGNLSLLLIGRERYIENLRAFYLNIRLSNGWGLFGIPFLAYACWVFYSMIKHWKGDSPLPWLDLIWISAFMMIVAVSWARGGALAVRTSDSGNRVMMQIVPLVVYAGYLRTINWIQKVGGRA
ncbi:MAG: hypothetical protein J6P05_01120 [Lachnospiraceae bacterium]|nr:hypothetical protein [Lachnospiraceae bacterium]